MIDSGTFVRTLSQLGTRFFTGVPCSYFKGIINYLDNQAEVSYILAPNEGSALAMASGAHLSGNKAAVMIQNSGLGNLMNPLTSLNAIYDIPVLVFVSGRAYGIPDEPQHEIIGAHMGEILDAVGAAHEDLPTEQNELEKSLQKATAFMNENKKPFFYFVKKGTFSEITAKPLSASYPLKRIEALKIIAENIAEEDYVFTTTGKPSREFFTVLDRPRNFYMQGSMGHIASLALGFALNHPQNRVWVIDGDGAFLMHMGAPSSIGHYGPPNLYHLVLDNESYETTGDQDTTASTTDFVAIARACGYSVAECVKDESGLKLQMGAISQAKGPALLRIKINREPTPDIPRITTRYRAPEITAQLVEEVRKDKLARP